MPRIEGRDSNDSIVPLLIKHEDSDGEPKKLGFIGSIKSTFARFSLKSSSTKDLNTEQDVAARKSLDEGQKASEEAPTKLTQSFTSTLSEKISHYKESISNAWNRCFSSKLDKTEDAKSQNVSENLNKSKASMDPNRVRAELRHLAKDPDTKLDRDNPPKFIKDYVNQRVDEAFTKSSDKSETKRQELKALYTEALCDELETCAKDPAITELEKAEEVAISLTNRLPDIDAQVLTKFEESSFKKATEKYLKEGGLKEGGIIDRNNPPEFIKKHAQEKVNAELEGAAKYFRHEVQEESSVLGVFKEAKSINDYKADVKEKLVDAYTNKLCDELENASKSGKDANEAAATFENRAENISMARLFKNVAETDAAQRKETSQKEVDAASKATGEARVEYEHAKKLSDDADARVTTAKNAVPSQLFKESDVARKALDNARQDLEKTKREELQSLKEKKEAEHIHSALLPKKEDPNFAPAFTDADNNLKKAESNHQTKLEAVKTAEKNLKAAQEQSDQAEANIVYSDLAQARLDAIPKNANMKTQGKNFEKLRQNEKNLRKEIYQNEISTAEKDQWMTDFLNYKETHVKMLKTAEKPYENISYEEGCEYIDSLSEHIENMEAMGAKKEDIDLIKKNSAKVALEILKQGENALDESNSPNENNRMKHVHYADKIENLFVGKNSLIEPDNTLIAAINEAKTHEIPADKDMKGQVTRFLQQLEENPDLTADDLPPAVLQHIEKHVDKQMEGTATFLRGNTEQRSKLGFISVVSQAHHINVYKKQTKKELIDSYKQEVFTSLKKPKSSSSTIAERAAYFEEMTLPNVSVAKLFLANAAEKQQQRANSLGVSDMTETSSLVRPKDGRMKLFLEFKEKHTRFEATANKLEALANKSESENDVNEKSAKEGAQNLAEAQIYVNDFNSHIANMKKYNYSQKDIEPFKEKYITAASLVLKERTKELNSLKGQNGTPNQVTGSKELLKANIDFLSKDEFLKDKLDEELKDARAAIRK